MVVVGYYHLFTRRQASNKAEESKMLLTCMLKVGSGERFLRRKDFPTNRKESKVRSWTEPSLA